GHVLNFLRVVFRTCVNEGYGQTEATCATNLCHSYQQNSHSHVGPPVACMEVRLETIEDMDYRVTDTFHSGEKVCGRGEVCIKGPCVMDRYYGFPEKTAETLGADGWL